jgi:hypothetical protein
MTFSYTVTARFPRSETAAAWIAWMRDEHLEDVIAAGALRGSVIALDGETPSAEARYEFANRAAYEEYLHNHAPRLRARGNDLFGNAGLAYERRAGEVVIETPAPRAQ